MHTVLAVFSAFHDRYNNLARASAPLTFAGLGGITQFYLYCRSVHEKGS